ncbi:MAG: bifunctional UDP-N-acetylglucosamine diphosphorylase/glucosamine-1-phosphate N-acetyltransferase GlmU [Bdellovibrionales bacterium]
MKKLKNKDNTPLACIILAAGQGTRMKSSLPKVLHKIAGSPMIAHVICAAQEAGASQIIPVIAPAMDDVRAVTAPYECAIQKEPLGTGDAVKAARGPLNDFQGHIMVLFGDTPLIKGTSLETLLDRKNATSAAMVVSSFTPDDPASYGRLMINDVGELEGIVEAADATPEQLCIKSCNGGIMLFDSVLLWQLLEQLGNNNAKGEYYLTDCVALARARGQKVVTAELDTQDTSGVNTRIQLAESEKEMQKRLRHAAMEAGVTMQDPDSVFLCPDTKFGRDVVIEPHVVFGPHVTVGDNVTIRAFSHIEGATIDEGAIIGPYARLRPDTHICKNAKVGNFVEVKKATLEEGAKVNHLSYIGDARVGSRSNIGAGTITCNYDGFNKSKTDIGEGVFIGSNSALVAPVKIGDGAFIAAGSTITKDIPAEALALARAPQDNKDGLAKRLRERKESGKK